MLDQTDLDNLSVIYSKMKDGSIDNWLSERSEDELEYAVNLLKAFNNAKENFCNLI